ncbi:hypothetical protein Aperf_G00000032519 [Anoplocephala perfoliata]
MRIFDDEVWVTIMNAKEDTHTESNADDKDEAHGDNENELSTSEGKSQLSSSKDKKQSVDENKVKSLQRKRNNQDLSALDEGDSRDREELKRTDAEAQHTPAEIDIAQNIAQVPDDGETEVSEDETEEEDKKSKPSDQPHSSETSHDEVGQSHNSSETSSTTAKTASSIDTTRERRRWELLERQKDLLERQRRAAQLNLQLQTTLFEHFRRKRADAGEVMHSHLDSMASSVIDTGIDYSARYGKHLETLRQVKKQYLGQKERLEAEINSLKNLSNQKIAEAARKRDEFADFILKQGRQAISSRTGRTLPMDHYKNLIESWQKKTAIVSQERLENLKLQRQVEKINATFKAYDLSESLHLIDFEQMKIENQTYNEKIEERNEETGKLRRKINHIVQMMTHANEKLHCSHAEYSQLKNQLNLWTDKLSAGRDSLSKLKQSRDALKGNLAALQRACGLLGQREMLRGFEQTVDDVEAKKQELSSLTQQTRKFRERARLYEQEISQIKEEKSPVTP